MAGPGDSDPEGGRTHSTGGWERQGLCAESGNERAGFGGSVGRGASYRNLWKTQELVQMGRWRWGPGEDSWGPHPISIAMTTANQGLVIRSVQRFRRCHGATALPLSRQQQAPGVLLWGVHGAAAKTVPTWKPLLQKCGGTVAMPQVRGLGKDPMSPVE